jgi:hypothetical protein
MLLVQGDGIVIVVELEPSTIAFESIDSLKWCFLNTS